MFRIGCAAIVAAGLMLTATAASAATVTLNTVLDLADGEIQFPYYMWTDADFGAASVDLSNGDVLDWTIQFQPGQELALQENTLVQFSVTGTGGNIWTSLAGTVELYGTGGALLASYVTPAGSGSVGVFLNTLSHPAIADAPVTLTAVRYLSGTLQGNLSTPDHLDSFFLALGEGALVPEPSSWALMIMGFGWAGAMLRRRDIANS